jgi:hypothetical protein
MRTHTHPVCAAGPILTGPTRTIDPPQRQGFGFRMRLETTVYAKTRMIIGPILGMSLLYPPTSHA